jgi:uncharacterized protein (TIGR03067 family)
MKLVSLASLLGIVSVLRAQPPAGDPEAVQGRWRVLAVVQNFEDRLNDPALRDSVVDINAKGLEWKDSKGKVKFAANYVLRPAAKNNPAPAEIDGVIRTDDGPDQTLPGIYVLFTPDYLKISFRQRNLDKGRPKRLEGTADHILFVLERERVKPGPPADVAKHQELLAGEWMPLLFLDDGFEGAGKFSGAKQHIGTITVAGQARVHDVRGKLTARVDHTPRRLDFNEAFFGAGSPPADGFLPGIYEFLDQNTLKICYPESGWKKDSKPQDRKRPDRFMSDGNTNYWILKRLK